MTVDREQTRRDALTTNRVRINGIMQERSGVLAEHILALLAELEQAERAGKKAHTDEVTADWKRLDDLREQAKRERDEARQEIEHPFDRSEFAAMQARLVKADTLAEALRGLMAALAVDEDGGLIGPLEQWAGAWVAALEALAAYKQEQKP